MSRPFGTALAQASPEAWRTLDSTRPHPKATDPDAVRFHSAWLRILLIELDALGTAPITHEAAARILDCPVSLIPTLLDRLRRGDEERPPLTEADFARVAKAN
jgi:hypothetical protein